MKYSQKELLLSWVSCAGYLRKVKDGVHISRSVDDDGVFHFFIWEDNEPRRLNGAGDGGIKIYQEVIPRRFKGVVIGFKNKEVASRLYLADDDDDGIPDEIPFDRRVKVRKEIIEMVPCAIVAYGNNRKHIVPLECIEHLLNVEPIKAAGKSEKDKRGGTQLTWLNPDDDKDEPF